MKNWIGLLIAISLAMVAGVLNWKYLERKSDEIEMISFISIKDGVMISPGDTFLEKHFSPMNIPKKSVGYLKDNAVLYDDRFTVISMKAIHHYRGGEMIFTQELKTPPEELKLGPNEMATWIPIGASFVSSLVVPGDMVSFIINDAGGDVTADEDGIPGEPDGGGPENWNENDQPAPTFSSKIEQEIVGPFRVLSLGGRLGSPAVSRAAGMSSSRENVLTIAIKKEGKEYEPNAVRLLKRVNRKGFRQAGVLLHPRSEKKK
ncbi:MAG: hypothetical protein AB8B55_11545 [Mariniblastus sp.]